MTKTLLERMQPLWDAAAQAFRSDPSYAIEMAKAGSSQVERQERSLVSVGQSGSSAV